MRFPLLILGWLALWAPATGAFFAFCPQWHAGCGPESAAGLAGGDGGGGTNVKLDGRASSGGPAGPPPSAVPGVLTFELGRPRPETVARPDRLGQEVASLRKKFARLGERDNRYNIEPATAPTQEHAVGIAQDGTDFSYFITARLGDKGKALYMLTDTGAGTSWVMGAGCTSAACGLHDSFGPADSATLKTSTDRFSIGYSSGSVSGFVANDSISVAGLTLDFQFGIADQITDEFSHFPFDGLLGLARNGGRTTAFLQTVGDAHVLPANVFCFYLGRASDGPNTGELDLGAVDPAKFTGEIAYTPLVDPDGDWIIQVDGASYGGRRVVGAMPAYIDTGTTYIFGPADVVARLHAAIHGAETADNITYTVPCDAGADPALIFSGVSYTISRDDWLSPPGSGGVCTSNIYGIEVLAGSLLIGGTFLKNVYSVFDSDQARIGFAQKVVAPSSGSGSHPGTVAAAPATPTSITPATSGPSPPGMTGQETAVPTQGTSDQGHGSSAVASRPRDRAALLAPLVCIAAGWLLLP